MTKASQIEVSHRAFKLVHGRSPRGRGTWIFRVVDLASGRYEEKGWNGQFSDCLRKAIEYAADNDMTHVEVAP